MLQTLTGSIYDNRSSLIEKQRELRAEKQNIERRINAYKHEIHLCVQELKVVNVVKDQKESLLLKAGEYLNTSMGYHRSE